MKYIYEPFKTNNQSQNHQESISEIVSIGRSSLWFIWSTGVLAVPRGKALLCCHAGREGCAGKHRATLGAPRSPGIGRARPGVGSSCARVAVSLYPRVPCPRVPVSPCPLSPGGAALSRWLPALAAGAGSRLGAGTGQRPLLLRISRSAFLGNQGPSLLSVAPPEEPGVPSAPWDVGSAVCRGSWPGCSVPGVGWDQGTKWPWLPVRRQMPLKCCW